MHALRTPLLGLATVAMVATTMACSKVEAPVDKPTENVGGAGAGGTESTGEPTPAATFVPVATNACPTFAQGTATFNPDGKARNVELFMSDKAYELSGPLVFYWHGNGDQPLSGTDWGMGDANIKWITDLGGIVVSPYRDPQNTTDFDWYLTVGSEEDDLRLADEVLACAIENVGIDMRRIHAMGISAGGLHTVQMGYRRSGYIASVVVMSGGLFSPRESQDPANLFPAMIFHGGPSDQVIVNFKDLSEKYRAALQEAGQFSILCDHGMGHTVPLEARPSMIDFLLAHPFGTNPSPYAKAMPPEYPAYCTL